MRAGDTAPPRALSNCARLPPPNSRASMPAPTTVAAAARAEKRRRLTTDTPNTANEIRATSGVKIGWST